MLGSGIGALAQQAIALGADKVYVVDDAQLKDYQPDAYISVLEKVVKQVKPQIVIMGQTDTGRELAPRLAFRLGTAATLDCVDLAIDPDIETPAPDQAGLRRQCPGDIHHRNRPPDSDDTHQGYGCFSAGCFPKGRNH